MKTRSWRKACFFRLNEIAVSNCHIIYQEWHDTFEWTVAREDLAEDLLSLVKSIEGIHLPMKRRHRKVAKEERLNRSLGHYPDKIVGVRGNCAVPGCMRRRSCYFCSSCEVFLCLGQCYRVFHTEEVM